MIQQPSEEQLRVLQDIYKKVQGDVSKLTIGNVSVFKELGSFLPLGMILASTASAMLQVVAQLFVYVTDNVSEEEAQNTRDKLIKTFDDHIKRLREQDTSTLR